MCPCRAFLHCPQRSQLGFGRSVGLRSLAPPFELPTGGRLRLAGSGGTSKVIALSYGERGESGELWKEAGQTEEKVKAIRRSEGEEAAKISSARVSRAWT